MPSDGFRNVITIGNFDGVHLGHRALIDHGRELAGPSGNVKALVFDPHPATVLRPDRPAPLRLTTFNQRAARLETLGADDVIRLDPTIDLLRMAPTEFLEYITSEHSVTAFVEGPDFHFGKNRLGDVDVLRREGHRLGFDVEIIDPVEIHLMDHTIVTASSTMVRWLLARSRVGDAARVLGRCYDIEGVVTPGDGRGRTIGIPTANVQSPQMLPARGVYAGWATRFQNDGMTESDAPRIPAAINVGEAPTFRSEGSTRLEVHLMDYETGTNDYDWPIRVEFETFVRDELRFEDACAAVTQIRRDIARIGHLMHETQQCKGD